MSSRVRSLGLAVLCLLSCVERRPDVAANEGPDDCTRCHGDPQRSGDALLRAAPPHDLYGESDPSYPGVGAHAIHLEASSTHAAIACNECHVVPKRVDEPGHADHGSPATLAFGELARAHQSDPQYDSGTRRCSDSYCHGAVSAPWNAPRSSQEVCGSCHGLPPALPHPQSDRCSACHGKVVDAARNIVRPELHVDGQVQYSEGRCSLCHGAGDDPAPPRDTHGNSAPSEVGVGAHGAHLASRLGRSLACEECHRVPERVADEGHIQGLPARVQLTGVATTEERKPAWHAASRTCSDSYCHSPTPGSVASSPSWVSAQSLSCTSCHGNPPPLPHPQASQCSACHGATVGADNQTIIELARHADGRVDVELTTGCTACHGAINAAPPRDLAGNSATAFVGVGAHQTHVQGTPRSRRVPCQECHVVPRSITDPGHLDSASPAELTFSGAAVASGVKPVYRNGSCRDTSCHGANLASGNDSGGSNTNPVWTKVDGSQAACGTCHGLPPPPPHPYGSLNPVCSTCHEDMAPDNTSFVRPDLHADGIVTFSVR
jgi:predicted CxxxxCH...CXXCH cytochrome family protein